MAKTLYIVNDEVFSALPEILQKNLLTEVKNLLSFIPLKVEARVPSLFPPTLHFTDSVVKLVAEDDDITGTLNGIRRQEDSNVRFSIKQKRIGLNLDPLSLSPAGDPDRGGVGGSWKTTAVEGGGKRVSITMTYGVASLESAEQAVVDEKLHGHTMEVLRNEERKAIAKEGPKYFATHKSLAFIRKEMDIELVTKKVPLKDWPKNLADNVVTALARIVAHEARHQYVEPHSARGLGSDSPTIFGDKNYEDFDGTDKANIVHAISKFDRDWMSASVHLETCPQGQTPPFS